MGFGILFLGYFIAFIGGFTPLSIYTYVLGAGIIAYSLKDLIYENKAFVASMLTAGALELVSIAVVIFKLFAFDNTKAYTVISTIQSYLAPALSIILLVAIAIIAKSVDLKKLQAKAIVDTAVSAIYVIFAVIFNFVDSTSKGIIGLISIIAQIISVLFALVIIFNCYMRICYEDDKDMQKEGTGFKALDFLNKSLNRVSKKNDKTGKKK